jgi:nicotinate-nucleotide pyrophosphorylase (carboxylating)
VKREFLMDDMLLFPYRDIVERSLAEDIRSGDVTSLATIPAGSRGQGAIVARHALIASSVDVAGACFAHLDSRVRFEARCAEGERVGPGFLMALVEGDLRSMLAAERTALNLLQRACGIATRTAQFVDAVAGTGVAILDTRKTAPGLRVLDKRAVRAGGGVNHRHALDDMILIKDNHVAVAGSTAEAVRRALKVAGRLRVQVEVASMAELEDLLSLPQLPDDVLLDNFEPEDVRDAVRRIDHALFVEVSGGVTLQNVRALADAGPDAISIGGLTHSAPAADIALDLGAPGAS